MKKTEIPSATPSLRRETLVVIAAQAAAQAVALAVLAVLYRLLGLEPYGLLGMVLPLLLLLRVVITGGLDVATIQQPEEPNDRQLAALFWLTQTLGLAMAAVMAASAPAVAWFYGRPELAALTLALAGIPPATVLGSQHLALLGRRLRLGSVAVLRLAALATGGGLGIAAAAAGWGVWALVVQQYAELLSLAAGAWLLEPWRPRLVLRLREVAGLVRFGGHYTVSGLMFFLVANADKVLVGYVLGPAALGLYGQAFNLMMRPVNVVMTPLSAVMLPALCRAASRPRDYALLLLGFFRFIALVMFPAAVGLAIVAPEAIRVLGGPQWAPAGAVLAVLAGALLVQGFFNALGSVLVSAGRADRLARAAAVIAAVFLAAFVGGLHLGLAAGEPLLALGLSYSLVMLLVVFPPYLAVALWTVDIGCGVWLAQLGRPAAAALGMGVLVAACHGLLGSVLQAPDVVLLGVELLVGAGSYALFARREIGWLLRAGLDRAIPSLRDSR
jgi:O-antigen/teichoic acid export membrane protein